MPSNLLRAMSGQQASVDSESAPASYPTGGFSVQTSLGRADEATAQIDSASYEARVDSAGTGGRSGIVNVQVYSQDGTGEVAGGTDLSSDTVVVRANRL